MSQSYKSSTDPRSTPGTSGLRTYSNHNGINTTFLKSTGEVEFICNPVITGNLSVIGNTSIVGTLTVDGITTSQDIDMQNNDIVDVKGVGFKDGQELTWNPDFGTVNVPTGLGPVIQVGQEFVFLVENNTGVDIADGKIVKISGSVEVPSIQLAKADFFPNCGGTLLVSTMVIPAGERGYATFLGRITDIDVGAIPVSTPIYLSDTDTPRMEFILSWAKSFTNSFS